MRSIWLSLAWKEWHEHKWKFASILGALWACVAISLVYGGRDGFGMAGVTMSFCIVPFAIFVGLGAAASERSRGTLAFLQALPTPMWPAALMKLVLGLLTLLVSIALTVPLYYGWAWWLEDFGDSFGAIQRIAGKSYITNNFYLDVALGCIAIAVSLFIWTAAAGVNRKDEVSAGAVTLAAIVGWYCLLFIGAYVLTGFFSPFNRTETEERVIEGISLTTLPLGPGGLVPASAIVLDNHRQLSATDMSLWMLFVVSVATAAHLALAGSYLRRFARIENIEVRSQQTAAKPSAEIDWLSAPRRSPLTAIAWKQARESGPLVVAGLAGIVGMTLAMGLANQGVLRAFPERLALMLAGVSVWLGTAITLITGIGICFHDVVPQVNTFWRSRPIDPNLWFWSKYATGLAVLLCILDLPILTVLTAIQYGSARFQASVLMSIAAQLALFAAAVATTCLVRHAVYSAILSIPLMFVGLAVVWIVAKAAATVGWTDHMPETFDDLSPSQFTVGYLLTFIACTLLGWLAIRYDWGRKSRY